MEELVSFFRARARAVPSRQLRFTARLVERACRIVSAMQLHLGAAVDAFHVPALEGKLRVVWHMNDIWPSVD